MLTSCRISDQGCWMWRRRARDRRLFRRHPEAQRGNHLLAPRAVQQVERHRNGRDRAEDGANWSPRERFRKYIADRYWPLAVLLHERIAEVGPMARAVGIGAKGEVTTRRRYHLPHSLRPLASCDSPHANQLAENHALQRLRGGDSGIAAAAADGHGLDGGAYSSNARV